MKTILVLSIIILIYLCILLPVTAGAQEPTPTPEFSSYPMVTPFVPTGTPVPPTVAPTVTPTATGIVLEPWRPYRVWLPVMAR